MSERSEPLGVDHEYMRRRARQQRCVTEMVRLFLGGHDTEQTPEYEAWRMEYLQAMTDAQYPDLPEGTHSHFNTG